MSRTLFPMTQPRAAAKERQLPLCREVKWDFELGRPVFKGGEPMAVEGADAVLVWAWLALHTPRFRHTIYSESFGTELESLIGQPYTASLKQSEARRFVEECLMESPYIKSVDDIRVDFADGRLDISCAIDTIYGKREVNAHV